MISLKTITVTDYDFFENYLYTEVTDSYYVQLSQVPRFISGWNQEAQCFNPNGRRPRYFEGC